MAEAFVPGPAKVVDDSAYGPCYFLDDVPNWPKPTVTPPLLPDTCHVADPSNKAGLVTETLMGSNKTVFTEKVKL
eukprot:4656436-Prymnesium_polylepis.1